MPNETLWFVKEVGTDHRTKDLHLPQAIDRLKSWTSDLKLKDGELLALNWENNQWPKDAIWLPPDELYTRVRARLDKAAPGIDAFVKGTGKTIIRIKTIEDLPEPPQRVGASAQLAHFLDAAWQEFPGAWQNWGIHVCRKIYGSSSWSQHSWDDACDMGVGNDKKAGDEIHRWSVVNEKQFGGYCENIWWETPSTGDPTQDHRDHGHRSLAPCHKGTPPCA